MSHVHMAERQFFNETRVPGLDRPAISAGAGFRFAHDGPLRENAVPKLGEHTDEVLRDLGFDTASIDEMRRTGTT